MCSGWLHGCCRRGHGDVPHSSRLRSGAAAGRPTRLALVRQATFVHRAGWTPDGGETMARRTMIRAAAHFVRPPARGSSAVLRATMFVPLVLLVAARSATPPLTSPTA